ncbi:REP-associated tyrosine transposase [Luteitalea sp.]|jgi:putative transposase|uniref:REP-associated tyrosine transposase n=1 Tax=Luteitalea sp. TaxID=2004800 RepID=UPI0037C63AD9
MVGRLRGWDYRSPGAYLVTACTHRRRPIFGEVVGETVVLSELGRAAVEALETTAQRHHGVLVGAFVVMPDHIHAVIEIGLDEAPTGSLSHLVREVKARVTMAARVAEAAGPQEPLWQRGYHDRIIRSDAERAALLAYIAENPLRWTLREAAGRSAST